jgi:hypothetical protein
VPLNTLVVRNFVLRFVMPRFDDSDGHCTWCSEEMVSRKPFLTAVDSLSTTFYPVLLLSYVHAPLTKSGANRCSFCFAEITFLGKQKVSLQLSVCLVDCDTPSVS